MEPVIVELSRWGANLLSAPQEGEDLRPGWAAVAVRSTVNPTVVGGRAGIYEFRIDGDAFHLRLEDGEEGGTELRQGPAPDPDLVVAGDTGTFLAVTSGRMRPEEAVGSGALRVEGGTAENPDALLTSCLALIGPAAG